MYVKSLLVALEAVTIVYHCWSMDSIDNDRWIFIVGSWLQLIRIVATTNKDRQRTITLGCRHEPAMKVYLSLL